MVKDHSISQIWHVRLVRDYWESRTWQRYKFLIARGAMGLPRTRNCVYQPPSPYLYIGNWRSCRQHPCIETACIFWKRNCFIVKISSVLHILMIAWEFVPKDRMLLIISERGITYYIYFFFHLFDVVHSTQSALLLKSLRRFPWHHRAVLLYGFPRNSKKGNAPDENLGS